jgi:phage terminase small subunit
MFKILDNPPVPNPILETMTGFPKPPKNPRAYSATEAPPQPTAHVKPTIGPLSLGDTSLTEEETSFIFRTHLRPSQADDPVIVKFILAYCASRNSAQAAKECGILPRQGHALRQRPEIHACIQAITDKAVMKYGFDATEIVERVKEIAILDPVEFENPDGSFKTHLSQIAPEARRAIKKFKAKNIYGEDPNGMRIVIGQLIEVELWDKLKGIELLGREKNIFKETKKVEHDVTQNMASLLLESKKRAETRQLTNTEVRQIEAIDVTPEE